jgi:phosphoribosylamine--glycine ligase
MNVQSAMTVVMAAKGYPGTPEKGCAIAGIDKADASGAKVFQAGTAREDGTLVASGGRVLNVTATGSTLQEARDAAYKAIGEIDFANGFFRSDIGWRELERG